MSAVCQHKALLCIHNWFLRKFLQMSAWVLLWPSAAVRESLCFHSAPPVWDGLYNHINSTLFRYFRLNQFPLHSLKGCTNIRCLFFRVINLENQLGIPQNVPKASKNLTWCEIFSSQLLGNLLPSICKAQHRTSNLSTPRTVAAAEGNPAAAVMVSFTGKGYFSSKPASLTCKEQRGTSNLA